MKHIILVVALCVPLGANANVLRNGLDSLGIYGQVVGTPSHVTAGNAYGSITASGGNTTTGVGVAFNGANSEWWFAHLGFDYGVGPALNGGTYTIYSPTGVKVGSGPSPSNISGHSLQFNARFGKGFQVAQNVIVGPYIGYQCAQFTLWVMGQSAAYVNNALGGGVYGAIAPTSRITISGHIGYLGGISTNAPGANVLQVGTKADYRFDSSWSGFVGAYYDRYSASGRMGTASRDIRVNDVRGIFGLAYHY